jgi:hypothetical protein
MCELVKLVLLFWIFMWCQIFFSFNKRSFMFCGYFLFAFFFCLVGRPVGWVRLLPWDVIG